MNTYFFNTTAAPVVDDGLPSWALCCIREATEAGKNTIRLRDLPGRWFEFVAARARHIIHEGPYLTVEMGEFARIVKGGMPC